MSDETTPRSTETAQRPSEAAIRAAYDQRGDYDHRSFETFKQDTIAAWLRVYRPAQHRTPPGERSGGEG